MTRVLVLAALVLAAIAGLALWRHAGVSLPMTAPAGTAIAGGDGGALPRASATDEKLDAAALATALDAARADDARVFMVARHGHLIIEHYAMGQSAASLVDGGPMTETLLALALGSAVADGKLVAGDVASLAVPQRLAALRAATGESFENYLSRRLWQPLNAGEARLVGCCVRARPGDWLRVGMLLLQAGNFEGSDIVPAAWVNRMRTPLGDARRGLGLWLPSDASGAEPFAGNDVFYLRGNDRTRLWLAPGLQLAVLMVAGPAGANGWDETRLPNLVIRAVIDRNTTDANRSLLNQLVPGH